MRYKLAEDAKPQATLLLAACGLTIVLWFIPYAEYLVYPIRLFVTFIHESSHAIVAFITGGSVQSLTISADGSGVVYSSSSSLLSAVLTSSAGYLGATLFGVLLLFLIRKNVSPHKMLFASGVYVAAITLVFGILSPLFNFLSLNVGLSTVGFTIAAGAVLSAGLLLLAKFASERVARFVTAFLAAQCILNALSDLKTVLFINAPLVGSDMQNDALNMANATGIPGFIWVIVWIGIALAVIFLGIRMYVSVKSATPNDSLFND